MTFNLNCIVHEGDSVTFKLEGDGVVIDCSIDLENAASFAGKVLGFKEQITPDKDKETE